MPREITSHKVNGLNDALTITALNDPDGSGSISAYNIGVVSHIQGGESELRLANIRFQIGPIQENGVNGISNESLLGIVEDRLKSFQVGPYACRENAVALTKIQEAMMWLHFRTRERVARGVEGTSAK